jgi:hypothetical protein
MSKLDGPAKKKVQSLAAALEADDTALIKQRWGGLRRMLGQQLGSYSGDIRKLLTDDQAARLERMTSFQA